MHKGLKLVHPLCIPCTPFVRDFRLDVRSLGSGCCCSGAGRVGGGRYWSFTCPSDYWSNPPAPGWCPSRKSARSGRFGKKPEGHAPTPWPIPVGKALACPGGAPEVAEGIADARSWGHLAASAPRFQRIQLAAKHLRSKRFSGCGRQPIRGRSVQLATEEGSFVLSAAKPFPGKPGARRYLGSLSKRNVQQPSSSTLRFAASWLLRAGMTP